MNFDLDGELDKRVNDEHRHQADAAVKNFALSGNKLFGILPIPEQLNKIVSIAVPGMIGWATAEAKVLAEKVRPGSGKYVGVALPLVAYAQPTVSGMIAYKKEISAFNHKLHPLFAANQAGKSGMGKLFDSGERPNAVIAFARNQKHGRHLNNLFGQGIESAVGFVYQQFVNAKSLQSKTDGLTQNEVVKEHFQGINPQLAVSGVVGAVGSWLKELVHSYLPKEFKGECALNACYAFVEDMESASRSLDPLDKRGLERELKTQSRKMVEIFRLRYRESGWKEMPERVQEKLEEVTEQLVRPMLMGELSPLAVINLAGENKILQNNGRNVAGEREVKEALDEQLQKLSMQAMQRKEDFYAETDLRAGDIAAVWKNLGPQEKAFFAIVAPDSVLLEGGMKREEIAPARKEGAKIFDDMAEGILNHLAKEPVDKLRDDFSKAQIAQLRELDRTLNEMNDSPRRREDDLSLLDEKEEVLHAAGVKNILAKAYMGKEKPAGWRKLLETNKTKEAEAAEEQEVCEEATEKHRRSKRGEAREDEEVSERQDARHGRDEEGLDEEMDALAEGGERDFGTHAGKLRKGEHHAKDRTARHGEGEHVKDHRERLSQGHSEHGDHPRR